MKRNFLLETILLTFCIVFETGLTMGQKIEPIVHIPKMNYANGRVKVSPYNDRIYTTQPSYKEFHNFKKGLVKVYSAETNLILLEQDAYGPFYISSASDVVGFYKGGTAWSIDLNTSERQTFFSFDDQCYDIKLAFKIPETDKIIAFTEKNEGEGCAFEGWFIYDIASQTMEKKIEMPSYGGVNPDLFEKFEPRLSADNKYIVSFDLDNLQLTDLSNATYSKNVIPVTSDRYFIKQRGVSSLKNECFMLIRDNKNDKRYLYRYDFDNKAIVEQLTLKNDLKKVQYHPTSPVLLAENENGQTIQWDEKLKQAENLPEKIEYYLYGNEECLPRQSEYSADPILSSIYNVKTESLLLGIGGKNIGALDFNSYAWRDVEAPCPDYGCDMLSQPSDDSTSRVFSYDGFKLTSMRQDDDNPYQLNHQTTIGSNAYSVRGVVASANGKYLACRAQKAVKGRSKLLKSVLIYDSQFGTEKYEIEDDKEMDYKAWCFHPSRSEIAIFDRFGHARVFDFVQNKLLSYTEMNFDGTTYGRDNVPQNPVYISSEKIVFHTTDEIGLLDLSSKTYKAIKEIENSWVNYFNYNADFHEIYYATATGEVGILDANSFRETKRFVLPQQVNGIYRNKQKKHLIVHTADGMVQVMNENNINENVKMYHLDGSDSFVKIDQDNYYSIPKEFVREVHFSVGMDVYYFDQFDLLLNRPDKIEAILNPNDTKKIQLYKQAWQKRVKKMGFDPQNLEGQYLLEAPEIQLLTASPEVQLTEKNFEIAFGASDKNYPLSKIHLKVNGVPVDGVKGKLIQSSPYQLTSHRLQIELSEGQNRIDLSVMNTKGVESLTKTLFIDHAPVEKVSSDLYLISIGVSKFQQAEFNLTYADKDARDIIHQYQTTDQDFDKIKVFEFTNEKANASDILALRDLLQQTKVNDRVLVFVASHGLISDQLDYYIAMHATNFNNPSEGSLLYDDLENLLDGIPAREKLVLLDVCHSGEIDKDEVILAKAGDSSEKANVSSRGFKVVKNKTNSSGLSNSFELMKELFSDLRRNNGAVVISSASGKEFAFESSEWQNGVFTYSLIEGIKTGNADVNKDKTISVSEVQDYVGRRVVQLTNGQQNPTSRTENLESDFRVW